MATEPKATDPKMQSVTIFGHEYKLKGADPDYIQVVAAYVDGKMKEVEKRIPSGTPSKIAILTSLNIADELFREREQRTQFEQDFKTKARRMEHALDTCLEGD